MPNLLLICRTIYDEGIGYFYGNNAFGSPSGNDFTAFMAAPRLLKDRNALLRRTVLRFDAQYLPHSCDVAPKENPFGKLEHFARVDLRHWGRIFEAWAQYGIGRTTKLKSA